MISDLDESLGSQPFLNVMNEWKSFAPLASACDSSRLVIGLKSTFDQKAAYLFFTRLNEIMEVAKRQCQFLNLFYVT